MTASADREELDGSHSHTGLARLKSVSKSRKPYTITKQRERWTDSEHELFLEALKLYGRAWRSIQAAEEEIRVPPPRQKIKARAESVGVAAQVEGASSQPCTASRGKRMDSQHQQTAADVAAAAAAVAATAAFQVIQAAGKEVQAQLQASPPKGFPFFGMAPSALLSLSQADLQLSKAGSLSEAARSSLPLSAQMSVTNPSDVQLQLAGSTEVATDSARAQSALASFAAQRLKAVDRSSDLSETLSEHPPHGRASGELVGKLHISGLAHSGSTSLTLSQSGEGSSRLDDVDDGLNASAEAATHSAGANIPLRDVTQSAERVTQSAERLTQSGGGVTHDSGIASSSRQSQEREASKELADAMLLASVAASPMPAKANQQSFMPNTEAPRPDAFQALQAAAQHAQQAISHPQVPLPALYNQQRQQATSMWSPFLALYQMQAMMGGGLGDCIYPPTALGVAADEFMQQAQHAQQAQQALMLAAQQMASVGTSRAAPQPLGIAMGAGVGQVSSLLGHAQASLPQGLASTRSTSLPALHSTWLASGSAANPFAVPVPASSINPSWLASPSSAPKVDGCDR
ncbi:MAG: MYB transcription factor [Trebouxia sp. A1-2]|nr:MAG: MYB transcription factor [Trebouxia sp. A1-2]